MPEIHVDTDIGGDIDDLCALALVVHWPGAKLCGVTTVAEHGGKRAGYVKYVLELAGRRDIPVAAGADAALGCFEPWPALPPEERYWPEPIPSVPTPASEALDLLARSIERGATIVGIGPFTNLALLQQRTPGILRRARLVLMGGHPFMPRKGYPQWNGDEDYNVQADAASALIVMARSAPTLVPLAVTVETALRRSDLNALRASGPLARLIAAQAEAYAEEHRYESELGSVYEAVPDDIINFHHDPLACAIALGWSEAVTIREVPLVSELVAGRLRQRVSESGQRTKVVTEVSGRRFGEDWLRIVTRESAAVPGARA
jgi:inosine-uridine nucleoside N-ribohydrolase